MRLRKFQIEKFFCHLHFRIPCRFDQVNKKISVIYTLRFSLSGKFVTIFFYHISFFNPKKYRTNSSEFWDLKRAFVTQTRTSYDVLFLERFLLAPSLKVNSLGKEYVV